MPILAHFRPSCLFQHFEPKMAFSVVLAAKKYENLDVKILFIQNELNYIQESDFFYKKLWSSKIFLNFFSSYFQILKEKKNYYSIFFNVPVSTFFLCS